MRRQHVTLDVDHVVHIGEAVIAYGARNPAAPWPVRRRIIRQIARNAQRRPTIPSKYRTDGRIDGAMIEFGSLA